MNQLQVGISNFVCEHGAMEHAGCWHPQGIGYAVQWSRVWLVSQDRIHEVSATGAEGAVSDLSACAAAHRQKR